MKRIYLKPMAETHQLKIETYLDIVSPGEPAPHGDANSRKSPVVESTSDPKRSLWGE